MNVLHEDFDPARALAEDKEGVMLRAVKDALEQGRAGLRRRMDAGLPPEQFTLASNLQGAIQQAQDIVDQYWAQPRH